MKVHHFLALNFFTRKRAVKYSGTPNTERPKKNNAEIKAFFNSDRKNIQIANAVETELAKTIF